MRLDICHETVDTRSDAAAAEQSRKNGVSNQGIMTKFRVCDRLTSLRTEEREGRPAAGGAAASEAWLPMNTPSVTFATRNIPGSAHAWSIDVAAGHASRMIGGVTMQISNHVSDNH